MFGNLLANIGNAFSGAASGIGGFLKGIFAPSAGGDNPNVPGTEYAPQGATILPTLSGAGKAVSIGSSEAKFYSQAESSAQQQFGVSPYYQFPPYLASYFSSTTPRAPISTQTAFTAPVIKPPPSSATITPYTGPSTFTPKYAPVSVSGQPGQNFSFSGGGGTAPPTAVAGTPGTPGAGTGFSSSGAAGGIAPQIIWDNSDNKLKKVQGPQGGDFYQDASGNWYQPTANPTTGQTNYQLVTSLPAGNTRETLPSGQTAVYGGTGNVPVGPQTPPFTGQPTPANPSAASPTPAAGNTISGGIQNPQNTQFGGTIPPNTISSSPNPWIVSSNASNNPITGTSFNSGSLPTSTDLEGMQSAIDSYQKIINSGNPLDSVSREQLGNYLSSALTTVKQWSDQVTGIDQAKKGSVEQPSVAQAIQNNPPLQERIDAFKQNLPYIYTDPFTGQTYKGYQGALNQRLDLVSQLNSENMLYTKLLNDTRTSTIPSAVASARMRDFQVTHSQVVLSLQKDLELVNQTVSDFDNQIRVEFGIVSTQADLNFKAADLALGALSNSAFQDAFPQMNARQLSSFAQQYGLDPSQMQNIQNGVRREKGIQHLNFVSNGLGTITVLGVDPNQLDANGNPIPITLGTMTGVGQISPQAILGGLLEGGFKGSTGGVEGPPPTISGTNIPATVPNTNIKWDNYTNIIDPASGKSYPIPFLDLTSPKYSGVAGSVITNQLPPNIPALRDSADATSFAMVLKGENNLNSAYNLLKNWGGNPTDPTSRLYSLISQPVSAALQSDPQLAVLRNLLNDPALQNAISTSGVTGGRFGTQMAKVSSALENFLKPSDTWGVTLAKMKDLMILYSGIKAAALRIGY